MNPKTKEKTSIKQKWTDFWDRADDRYHDHPVLMMFIMGFTIAVVFMIAIWLLVTIVDFLIKLNSILLFCFVIAVAVGIFFAIKEVTDSW